jgi:hypothetical protein
MNITKKVTPYIPKGLVKKEIVNNIKFEIRNTKQEETFLQFSQPNSFLNKLCLMASEDSLLRLFFFLKPHMSYRPTEEYPINLGYPLLVGFDEDFLNSILKEPMKSKVEDTKQKREETEKNVRDLSSRMMWKVFSIALRDKQVRERLKRKKLYVKEEEMDDLFESLVNRRKEQFASVTKDLTDIYGSWYYAVEYYAPLIEAFEHVEEAKENLAVLSLAFEKNEDLAEGLSNSLSKLIAQRVFCIKILSFCMECTLKKGFEPYSTAVKYPVDPHFPSTCKKCGGKTIFHTLDIEAPYAFGPLFEENRLPEFIIGYTLAMSKEIEKLYIHKNVQVITEKGPLRAQQVNVFAITRNGKILLIEVTTARDLNKVWEAVHKKEEALKDLPYDALVFITPSQAIEQYPRLNKVRIFGARHIPKIVSHIEHLIEEISKT